MRTRVSVNLLSHHDFLVFAEEKLQNRRQKPFVPYHIGERGSTAKQNYPNKKKTRGQRTSSNGNPATPAAADFTAVPPPLSQHNKQRQHSQQLCAAAAAAATSNSSSTASSIIATFNFSNRLLFSQCDAAALYTARAALSAPPVYQFRAIDV